MSAKPFRDDHGSLFLITLWRDCPYTICDAFIDKLKKIYLTPNTCADGVEIYKKENMRVRKQKYTLLIKKAIKK